MKEECAAHAYDLMTNHVHLLATHAGTRSALCPLRQ
jgi:REP element-mobilizing transposase RayT